MYYTVYGRKNPQGCYWSSVQGFLSICTQTAYGLLFNSCQISPQLEQQKKKKKKMRNSTLFLNGWKYFAKMCAASLLGMRTFIALLIK